MPDATYRVTIHKPASEVFEMLAAEERAKEWRPGVLEINRRSGEAATAIVTQWVRGPGGRRVAADYRVTEYEPNRLLSFEAIAGPVRPAGKYELSESNGTTTVTFSLTSRLGGFRKVFMGPMVNRAMQGEVRNLENLKRLMEGSGQEEPSPAADRGATAEETEEREAPEATG